MSEVSEPEAIAAPAPARPGLWARFRGYAWDWRAVVAVAVAMFIVGGLAGLAIGLAGGGHRHGFRDGRGGHPHPGMRGGFGPGSGPMMPGNGWRAPNN